MSIATMHECDMEKRCEFWNRRGGRASRRLVTACRGLAAVRRMTAGAVQNKIAGCLDRLTLSGGNRIGALHSTN
jgi:hypothetical protein